MALREWSVSRIKRIWVIAIGIQLALVSAWVLPDLLDRRVAASPPDPGPTIWAQLDSAEERALLARLRDSLGLALTVRDDTVQALRIVPAGRADSLARGFRVAMDAIGPTLLIIAVAFWTVFLSPTWVATIVTARWWHQRRDARAGIAVGDV